MESVFFVPIGELDKTHKIRLESNERLTIPPGGIYVENQALIERLRRSRANGTFYEEAPSPRAQAERVVTAVQRVGEIEAERDRLQAELDALRAQNAESLGRRKPGPKPGSKRRGRIVTQAAVEVSVAPEAA